MAENSDRNLLIYCWKIFINFLFLGYGDLVAAVQRLQTQLKKAGTGRGLGGLEGRVAAVQSLLLSPQFGRALAIHNKVQAVRSIVDDTFKYSTKCTTQRKHTQAW